MEDSGQRYMVFLEEIYDNITGIRFLEGTHYAVTDEDDEIYFIDCDLKNQKDLKNNVNFNKYGFEKLLKGKIFDII